MNKDNEQREIKTDNELIAEFMRNDAINSPHITKPDYTSSWDLLMPVVEKIEGLQYKKYLYEIKGYTFIINGRCAEIMDIERERIVKQQVGESKIEAVYKAVVQFIHWYNENKPGKSS